MPSVSPFEELGAPDPARIREQVRRCLRESRAFLVAV